MSELIKFQTKRQSMNRITFFALIAMIGIAAGCGPSFTPALQKGEAVQSGKILVMGKIVIDPIWFTKRDIEQQGGEIPNILIGMTYDLSKEATEGKLYYPDEGINPFLSEFFYYPLSPGKRYIRSGMAFKVKGHHMAGMVAGQAYYDSLQFYRNIRFEVPPNAKAVYIGTIVYKHDGKHATEILVRDEYSEAVQELEKMRIPGIHAGDLKKRLADVVK
jgi:hypothetical protein